MDPLATVPPHFIANDLALDFINTRFGVNAQARDLFDDDASVLRWLALAGVGVEDTVQAPQGLATLARALREEARALVAAARARRPLEADVVNTVLRAGQPVTCVAWDADAGRARTVHIRRDDSPASLLQPIAAALAQLLSHGKIDHVRQCEAHDCSLLFHDASKSHRRRWCSMALCGNRMKVAAFRSRRQGE